MAPWCWVQGAISNFRGLIPHPAGLGISLKISVLFTPNIANIPSKVPIVCEFSKFVEGHFHHWDEVGTTKHNWSAWCQYNVTGWVSMWAYDMLSQWGSTIKRWVPLLQVGTSYYRFDHPRLKKKKVQFFFFFFFWYQLHQALSPRLDHIEKSPNLFSSKCANLVFSFGVPWRCGVWGPCTLCASSAAALW